MLGFIFCLFDHYPLCYNIFQDGDNFLSVILPDTRMGSLSGVRLSEALWKPTTLRNKYNWN
jgi:hypothetical protein